MWLHGPLVPRDLTSGPWKELFLRVIYEDNHVLVVEKPVNVPVQADESGDHDLLSEAKAYIKHKYDKPGEVFLGLVHRLDRPVGGVMVFARTSKAAARLTASMKANRFEKRYAAIACAEAPAFGELNDHILRDAATHSSIIVPQGTAGAQRASLDFARVSSRGGRSLLDVDLHTGRHHQIRVQLAHAGLPIYGDQRYNMTAKAGQQIALHAYSLAFEHPTLKERMRFTSIPSGASWAAFENELAALVCGVRCAYVDESIIVANKNPDISCAEADGGDDTLETRLRIAFGEAYPVHRLDAPTSGLVLFARSMSARDVLQRLIERRKLGKTYRAWVRGMPKANEGLIRLFAKKDAEQAIVRVFESEVKGAAEMLTGYRTVRSVRLSDGSVISLLELELLTGRTHQIRASLAHIGCPVIGDDKYGDRKLNRALTTRLLLAATRIAFPEGLDELPGLSGRVIEIEPPFDFSGGNLIQCRI